MFRIAAEYLDGEGLLAQIVLSSPLTVGRTEEVPRYDCASLLHVMNSLPPEDGAHARRGSDLLSDEPTIELVVRARSGDRHAVEALLQRSVPQLKRWAHGRLPPAARSTLDTGDLVQETVLHVLRLLDTFQPHHVGAMQAYLRKSVLNRIRDEVRRIGRHPTSIDVPDDMPSDEPSPEEQAVKAEAVSKYCEALATLGSRDRQLVVARVEAQWTYDEIARHFAMPTRDAARMAVSRALRRLLDSVDS
jgi:RNA polymerase sigma-70 factor (ECF subfamily)